MMFFALGMSILTFFVKRLPSRGAGPFKAFASFLACVILNFLSHVMGTDVYARPVTAGLFWALVGSSFSPGGGRRARVRSNLFFLFFKHFFTRRE